MTDQFFLERIVELEISDFSRRDMKSKLSFSLFVSTGSLKMADSLKLYNHLIDLGLYKDT